MSEDGSTVKSVDLSKIQVNMIEERRFNINVHNVTGMLKVLDFGYVQGTGPAHISLSRSAPITRTENLNALKSSR